jgi:hypothetical protein
MSRNQRLRPLQPVYGQAKILGAAGIGNSPNSFALMTGGLIVTGGPTLVEHLFSGTASFPCTLVQPGTLDVAFVISGVGTFDGIGVSGSTSVTGPVSANVTSGTILVSYDPSTDWTPA